MRKNEYFKLHNNVAFNNFLFLFELYMRYIFIYVYVIVDISPSFLNISELSSPNYQWKMKRKMEVAD